MRVALIGYGYWGRILRRYLDADPRIRLARICSRDIQPDGLYTDDLEEVRLDEGIEALFICTPIDTHLAICERGLRAGKHIFCEKPTTKGWGQFQVLEQLAAENGRVLYTDYIYTVSPSIQKMRELLGRCGKIRLVRGGIGQFGAFYPGDSIYEVIGVHLFSILPYLFGDVAVTGCMGTILSMGMCPWSWPVRSGWSSGWICCILKRSGHSPCMERRGASCSI